MHEHGPGLRGRLRHAQPDRDGPVRRGRPLQGAGLERGLRGPRPQGHPRHEARHHRGRRGQPHDGRGVRQHHQLRPVHQRQRGDAQRGRLGDGGAPHRGRALPRAHGGAHHPGPGQRRGLHRARLAHRHRAAGNRMLATCLCHRRCHSFSSPSSSSVSALYLVSAARDVRGAGAGRHLRHDPHGGRGLPLALPRLHHGVHAHGRRLRLPEHRRHRRRRPPGTHYFSPLSSDRSCFLPLTASLLYGTANRSC